MRRFLLAMAAFLLASPLSAQTADSLAAVPTETLIDELTQLNAETPGADQTGWYRTFMAEDSTPSMEVGLLGYATPTVPPMMRELVRRGVAALPDLLHHLDDRRPTKLQIGVTGQQVFGGQFFGREYDPRVRQPRRDTCHRASCFDLGRRFETTYDVKVGDLCFVLIGQIVNRELVAVRYQPTAIVVVNAPTETPELAEETRADWQGLTAADHKASLLSDLRAPRSEYDSDGALARLRFYYPDAYAALGGRDALKREKFESDENKNASNR
jgi:hypothetical protein